LDEQTKQSDHLAPEQVDRMEQTARELIRHENDLVNQRIGWLVQTEGLLFAALAFSWTPAPKLSFILAAVGIATAASIGSAIALYSPAVRGIEAWWIRSVPEHQRVDRLVMGLSAPSRGLAKALRPWRALPYVFGVTWAAVVLTKVFGRAL
jgi:hypothetical protein